MKVRWTDGCRKEEAYEARRKLLTGALGGKNRQTTRLGITDFNNSDPRHVRDIYHPISSRSPVFHQANGFLLLPPSQGLVAPPPPCNSSRAMHTTSSIPTQIPRVGRKSSLATSRLARKHRRVRCSYFSLVICFDCRGSTAVERSSSRRNPTLF